MPSIFRDYGILIQSLLAFLMKGAGAAAAFAMSLVLAQHLGVEQSGYFFLAFTVIIFLGSVTRCGFDNVILRHTAEAKANGDWLAVRSLFVRGATISFAVSAFVALLLWSCSEFVANSVFNKPDFEPILEGIAPAVVSVALLWLVAQSLQGIGRASSAIIAMNIGANAALILAVYIFDITVGKEAAWAYSVASLTVLLGFLVFWHLTTNAQTHRAPYENSLRSMLASAWPLWIVLLMSQLIQWAGQFVGGAYLPPEEVAHLAVAQRTAMLVSFVLIAVNVVVAPRFAALYAKRDMDKLRSLALMSVRLMALVATPIVAVMLIFPESTMGLFGDDFKGGSSLLRVLVIGQFVNVLTGSVGYLLTMSGHEKDLRNTLLIVAPASIVAAFILTPLYGALGSAFSTTLAIGAQNILSVYWVKRRLGFNTLAIWSK